MPESTPTKHHRLVIEFDAPDSSPSSPSFGDQVEAVEHLSDFFTADPIKADPDSFSIVSWDVTSGCRNPERCSELGVCICDLEDGKRDSGKSQNY